ncbi:conserved hypothetical protein [Methanothermobacter marburgensis str. Marburg]|uniref:Uncharacterized protein n=2 Tax=Methanobacteriaceae TaxID=2159 RepID=D9PWV7_METTM|nr:conserved hypothetical protein [Methanothermobacter marburgensis str. Marburg]
MIYAFMGAYCYYHQQTEWARELGQTIIFSEKLDSLLDGNGTVNLEGLDDSIKKAYIGLVISMYIALEGPMAFVDILNYALVEGFIGLNMAAYATIIAYTGLLNITDDIKKFIIEHQTYISEDTAHCLIQVLAYVLVRYGGEIFQPIGWCMRIGDGILTFRDHYLPQEYWKYISIHRTWIYGYELRSYVGEDHCIHYIEIPKNPDGSLRWEDAVYI